MLYLSLFWLYVSQELREELHQMIRDGNVGRAKEIVAEPNGKWLLKAKNYYGNLKCQ